MYEIFNLKSKEGKSGFRRTPDNRARLSLASPGAMAGAYILTSDGLQCK